MAKAEPVGNGWMKQACLLATAALCLDATAYAHDTWVLPEKFRTAIGTVRLGMTSGMEFPRPETAVKPDRLARSGVRLGGSEHALQVGRAEGGALELTAPIPTEGVAVVWAQSLPRTLELKPDQVRHYLEEVGAMDTLGRSWEARGTPPIKESYIKLAKAYIRVGTAEDPSWREPIGLDLELVPEVDPTQLRSGDRLALKVLWKGKPLAGLAVAAQPGGSKPQMSRSTAEGRVEFVLAAAGPWLLKATRVVEVAGKTNEWESQFTTMTFEVR